MGKSLIYSLYTFKLPGLLGSALPPQGVASTPLHKLDVYLSPEGVWQPSKGQDSCPMEGAAATNATARTTHLESEEQQEGHHETEQTHGLRQGESQDSIREELLLQRGVAGIPDDQGAEHRPNTSTRAGHTHGGSTGTNELSSGVNVPGSSGGLEGAGDGRRGNWADNSLAPHLQEL